MRVCAFIDDKKSSTMLTFSFMSTAHFRQNDKSSRYSNFIIYDSRVGAVFCLLVRLFCANSNIETLPTQLAFTWSGKEKRNPNYANYIFRKFNNSHYLHAESNVKANWILKELIDKNGIFWDIKDNFERLRALEASLFMIGYSVIDN